jgi:hypothetical protein
MGLHLTKAIASCNHCFTVQVFIAHATIWCHWHLQVGHKTACIARHAAMAESMCMTQVGSPSGPCSVEASPLRPGSKSSYMTQHTCHMTQPRSACHGKRWHLVPPSCPAVIIRCHTVNVQSCHLHSQGRQQDRRQGRLPAPATATCVNGSSIAGSSLHEQPHCTGQIVALAASQAARCNGQLVQVMRHQLVVHDRRLRLQLGRALHGQLQ